ncbi:uncharacterized protein LOC131217351 [Magnolia sinica]|uniref:uncharacterized protein LOC131217351 n=1 Tax=Magnolia sinica TaxID=86752 RepID=UPI002658DB14|nr:uncharacterized protein LOC131217351 [Magnolia sinica]
MNDALRPFIDDFVIVYLNDILIFSRSWEEHLRHVRQVFQTLEENQLQLNQKKCEFGQSSLIYLGFIVGNGELWVDPAKANPPFIWNKEHEDTFFLLKRKINKVPVQSILHEEYSNWYDNDPDFQSHLADVRNGRPTEFALRNGLLYKGTLLCIPRAAERVRYIREAHTSKIAGHFGYFKTSKSKDWALHSVASIVQTLGEHFNRFPRWIAEYPEGTCYLFVVVDRFSKMVELMPCKKTITGEEAA